MKALSDSASIWHPHAGSVRSRYRRRAEPGGRTVAEARQLPAVTRADAAGPSGSAPRSSRIIEQPLGGGRDAPAGFTARVARLKARRLCSFRPIAATAVGAVLRNELVTCREVPGMAGELFNAEQLGPQRQFTRPQVRMRLPGDPGYRFQLSVMVHDRPKIDMGCFSGRLWRDIHPSLWPGAMGGYNRSEIEPGLESWGSRIHPDELRGVASPR